MEAWKRENSLDRCKHGLPTRAHFAAVNGNSLTSAVRSIAITEDTEL
jgi:hypothetical protein